MTGISIRRELAQRSSNGITVSLYWEAVGDTLSLEVYDESGDELYAVPATGGAIVKIAARINAVSAISPTMWLCITSLPVKPPGRLQVSRGRYRRNVATEGAWYRWY